MYAMKKIILIVGGFLCATVYNVHALSENAVVKGIDSAYEEIRKIQFTEEKAPAAVLQESDIALEKVAIFVNENSTNTFGGSDKTLMGALSSLQSVHKDFINLIKIVFAARANKSDLFEQGKKLDHLEQRLVDVRDGLQSQYYIYPAKKRAQAMLTVVMNSLIRTIITTKATINAMLGHYTKGVEEIVGGINEERNPAAAPARQAPVISAIPAAPETVTAPAVEPSAEQETEQVSTEPVKPAQGMKRGAPPAAPAKGGPKKGASKTVAPAAKGKGKPAAQPEAEAQPQVEETPKKMDIKMAQPAGKASKWTAANINKIDKENLIEQWNLFLQEEVKASTLVKGALSSGVEFMVRKFKDKLVKEGVKTAEEVDADVKSRIADVQKTAKESAVAAPQAVEPASEDTKETLIGLLEGYKTQIKAGEFDLGSPFKTVALQQTLNKLGALDKAEATKWVTELNDLQQLKDAKVKLRGPR